MARIAGVNIPDNKRLATSLTYIFGIGVTSANKILKLANLESNPRVKDLSNADIDKVRAIVEKDYKVEGDLRILIHQNIKRLKEINSYRGIRHNRKLPVRGQRTKTNARTKRGKKVTVGSGRKSANEKT